MEVIPAAVSCIEAVAPGCLEYVDFEISSERYIQSGKLIEEHEMDAIRGMDSILFGAIGDPRIKPGIMEKGVILALRKELNLFLNLRPSWSLPFSRADFRLAIARENTEEFYMGFGGKISSEGTSFLHRSEAWSGKVTVSGEADDEIFFNIGVMSRRNSLRFFRKSMELMDGFRSIPVTVVDKSNAVPGLYEIWRETASAEYKRKGVDYRFMYGDAVAYELVRNPAAFGLIVAPNLYGDILSDLCSGIMGGLGFTPSGNYGPTRLALFEPVHGSAPDIAGKGLANPIGAILSASMMLENLGLAEEAAKMRNAVDSAISHGIRTVDIGGKDSTQKVVDSVLSFIE